MAEYFAQLASSGPLLFGLGAAMLAGVVSFASPCVIPLVPGYMSYLASVVGASVDFDGARMRVTRKRRVVGAALLFVTGFTVVFVLATATVFGAIRALTMNADILQRVGGVITILMGLVFLGAIPLLQTERRFRPRLVTTWLGAPLLGGVFALGWTPCLGPTLAAIISISAGTQGVTAARGVALIVAYCLGLGIPFVLAAVGSAGAMGTVGWLARHSRTLQRIGGVALICVGIALTTGQWAVFISWVRQWTLEYGATPI